MKDRFLRMLLMFDLPVETVEDRRNYRRFRKLLIENGFVMMQESVYTKLLLSKTTEATTMRTIYRGKPPKGFVQVLTMTENQFHKMHIITGEYKSELLQSTDRLVIL